MLRVKILDGGSGETSMWNLWHLAWTIIWRVGLSMLVIFFLMGIMFGSCEVNFERRGNKNFKHGGHHEKGSKMDRISCNMDYAYRVRGL